MSQSSHLRDGMLDYRLEQNRREAFIRWFAWSLKYDDCDPAVCATNYLNKRYEHNDEQKLWLCWLYGNTYYLPTAWILMNEFPDFELATVDRITQWNTANYKRLRYQTDTKWNKGHLPAIFADNGDHGDSWMIDNILRAGFKGYENTSDEELEQELRERGLYDDDENVDIELDPYDETPHEFNTEGKFTIGE